MKADEPGEEEIFAEVVKLPKEQQADYLDKHCAHDPALRQRVERLLGALDRASPLLREPPPVFAGATGPRVSLAEKAGDKIGRYKLLEQIGEGGCGIVYVAEQEEPVRRRVALKVIKLGMDTKQVIARFDAERQALAMMEHPNIAKIHDAGATDAGRPFFVMELVRGIKITDFCEQQQLTARKRLDLFIQVCHAIQHAHQKGIIHRDIKPSNILVASDDGVPVPKVIDFGIAKATQERLTDQTVYTAFEQFIGTPAYMSPEQAQLSMQDIDTRSDIYSLGVLLYELLTGTTPFDAKELLSKGLDEMRRTIREVQPIKPSTRLTQTAKSESRNLKSEVKSAIPSDLDWIVMKCLEKDRSRRYDTANGLATDIHRHLHNEPISAHPPSRLYHFQKAVQRNKLVFTAAGAVVTALTFGFCVATWALVRERAARREADASGNLARAEAARNAEINKFFMNPASFARRSGDDPRLVREMLEELSRRIGVELKQPELQGDMWIYVAMRYEGLNDYPSAVTNAQKAVDAGRVNTNANPRLARALGLLGRLQSFNDESSRGKTNALLGLAIARQCGDPGTLTSCLIDAAKATGNRGEPTPEAIPLLREALHLAEGPASSYFAHVESLRLLAKALACGGERDEASTIVHEALKLAPSDQDLKTLLTTLDGERSLTGAPVK